MAACWSTSVRRRIAVGSNAGGGVVRLGDQIDGDSLDTFQSPRCAMVSGFSVHAMADANASPAGRSHQVDFLKGGNRIRWRRIRTLYQLIDSRTHFARQSFAVCKQIPDFGYPLNSDY